MLKYIKQTCLVFPSPLAFVPIYVVFVEITMTVLEFMKCLYGSTQTYIQNVSKSYLWPSKMAQWVGTHALKTWLPKF